MSNKERALSGSQAHWRQRLEAMQLSPCLAPAWAMGGHGQTILGSYLPIAQPTTPFQEQRIPLPGGDLLTADYYEGSEDVLVYLFHGLSGSNQAGYMHLAASTALARGYHVLSVNHRGCGTGVGLALEPYHSGRADDIAEVIRFGKRQFSPKKQVAVGFSLSGNALLLLAAGERGHEPLDLAVTVNAPIQLEASAIALKRGICKLYDARFSLRCRQAVQERLDAGLKPHYKVPWLCSLHDFDNHFTAPAGGFTDREDYYARCSASSFVHRISMPTVVLTSKNDPMVDYRAYLQVPFSEHVFLHMEEQGGHLGYLDKRHGRWLSYFLNKVLAAGLGG